MPLGQYDSDKLVNIGANRWSFKPKSEFPKRWGAGPSKLCGRDLYTKNDNFFGGKTREQAPIYSMQGHLIYNFPRGIWGALNTTYYTGGRTTVDWVEGDDLQRNWRLGATLALPVSPQHSVKLYGSAGVFSGAGGAPP